MSRFLNFEVHFFCFRHFETQNRPILVLFLIFAVSRHVSHKGRQGKKVKQPFSKDLQVTYGGNLKKNGKLSLNIMPLKANFMQRQLRVCYIQIIFIIS